MRVTCSEVFQDINDLISDGKLNVDGQDIALELFLSGDYKVMFTLKCTQVTSISHIYKA